MFIYKIHQCASIPVDSDILGVMMSDRNMLIQMSVSHFQFTTFVSTPVLSGFALALWLMSINMH